jgi:hypothetical protein
LVRIEVDEVPGLIRVLFNTVAVAMDGDLRLGERSVWAVYQKTGRWRLFATEIAAVACLSDVGARYGSGDELQEWLTHDADGNVDAVWYLERVVVEEVATT